MGIKVIKPALPGSPVGSIKSEAANTPFQRVRALDDNAGAALIQGGKQLSAAADQFQSVLDTMQKNDNDAALLDAQDKATKHRMATTAKWTGGGTAGGLLTEDDDTIGDIDPGATLGVRGRDANKAWFDSVMEQTEKEHLSIEEGLQGVNRSGQLAVRKHLQAQRLSIRASAMDHMVKESNSALVTALDNDITVKTSEALTHSQDGDAALASDAFHGALGSIRNKLELSGTLDLNSMTVAVQEQFTPVLTTAVDNILASTRPDKVTQAKGLLDAFATVKIAGFSIPMEPGAMEKMENLITSTQETDVIIQHAIDIVGTKATKPGMTNVDAQQAKMDQMFKDKEITGEQMTKIRAEVDKRNARDKVQKDADIERRKDTETDRVLNGHAPKAPAAYAGLGSGWHEAMETLAANIEERRLAGDSYGRQTDPNVNNGWYAQSQLERANMTEAQIINKYLPKLSTDDYKKVLTDWHTQRAAVGKKALTERNRHIKAHDKAVKRSYADFDKLLKEKLAAEGIDDDEEVGQMSAALRQSFWNEVTKGPLAGDEIATLIDSGVVQTGKGRAILLSYPQPGEALMEKVVSTNQQGAFAHIPTQQQHGAVALFMKENQIGPNGEIDPDELATWSSSFMLRKPGKVERQNILAAVRKRAPHLVSGTRDENDDGGTIPQSVYEYYHRLRLIKFKGVGSPIVGPPPVNKVKSDDPGAAS